jgi:hypothetical protein
MNGPFRIRVTSGSFTNLMKNPLLALCLAASPIAIISCEKKPADLTQKLEALEQKTNAAVARQKELEAQLEDQKLTAERDAIERERTQIAADRALLDRQKGEAAAAASQALIKREQALEGREGKLEQVQIKLDRTQADLANYGEKLSARERKMAGSGGLEFRPNRPSVPVGDYGQFHDALSSYGSWFSTPNYGYVWQPAAVRQSNWRPYSRGRWVCSDRGWTWDSEEPFGWATYHYGRWALLRGRGWIWVPGSEWAPSWVSWREADRHIGWAPLPPETLAYRDHRWDRSVDTQFRIGAACFNFIETQNFGGSAYRHCLPVSENIGYFQHSTNITNITVIQNQVICGGPQYENLCQRSGRPLPFYRLDLDQHSRPCRDPLGMHSRYADGTMTIAAPNMDAAWNDGLRPAKIAGRIDNLQVERTQPLDPKITAQFEQQRKQDLLAATAAIDELGGKETLEKTRLAQLEENRKQAESDRLKVEQQPLVVPPLEVVSPVKTAPPSVPVPPVEIAPPVGVIPPVEIAPPIKVQPPTQGESATVAPVAPPVAVTEIEQPPIANEPRMPVKDRTESATQLPTVQAPTVATNPLPPGVEVTPQPPTSEPAIVAPPQAPVREEILEPQPPIRERVEPQTQPETVRPTIDPAPEKVIESQPAIPERPSTIMPPAERIEPQTEPTATANAEAAAAEQAQAAQQQAAQAAQQQANEARQEQVAQQQAAQAEQAQAAQQQAQQQANEAKQQQAAQQQAAEARQEQAHEQQQEQQRQQQEQAREQQQEQQRQQQEQAREQQQEQQRQQQEQAREQQQEQQRQQQEQAREQQQEQQRQQQEQAREQQQEQQRQQQEQAREQQQEQQRQQQEQKQE